MDTRMCPWRGRGWMIELYYIKAYRRKGKSRSALDIGVISASRAVQHSEKQK